jgi:hypothetical protein
VFTARCALSPYIKQIRFFFKRLTWRTIRSASVAASQRSTDARRVCVVTASAMVRSHSKCSCSTYPFTVSICRGVKRETGLISFPSRCVCMFSTKYRANCGVWRPLRTRLLASLSIEAEMRARKGYAGTLFTSFGHLIIWYRCSLKVVLLTYYSVCLVFFCLLTFYRLHYYYFRW